MSDFWPGLDLEDTDTPLEILQVAKQQWEGESGRRLTLEIQEAESRSGYHLLIVHARHLASNRTVTLFTVVHRPDSPYPAKIQPRDNPLPDVLRKVHYKSGYSEISTAIEKSMEDLTGAIQNKWVSDTPAEFRHHLRDVMNLGELKADIVGLISNAAPAPGS